MPPKKRGVKRELSPTSTTTVKRPTRSKTENAIFEKEWNWWIKYADRDHIFRQSRCLVFGVEMAHSLSSQRQRWLWCYHDIKHNQADAFVSMTMQVREDIKAEKEKKKKEKEEEEEKKRKVQEELDKEATRFQHTLNWLGGDGGLESCLVRIEPKTGDRIYNPRKPKTVLSIYYYCDNKGDRQMDEFDVSVTSIRICPPVAGGIDTEYRIGVQKSDSLSSSNFNHPFYIRKFEPGNVPGYECCYYPSAFMRQHERGRVAIVHYINQCDRSLMIGEAYDKAWWDEVVKHLSLFISVHHDLFEYEIKPWLFEWFNSKLIF